MPASRWTFAQVGPNGDLIFVLGSGENGDLLVQLTDELSLQRNVTPTGSRIAATLGSSALNEPISRISPIQR